VSTILLVQGCSTVVSATTGGEGVKEDPGRRSIGTMIDDGSIETTVKVNIDAADPALKDSHINVISYNGVVLLVGQVPSQDLKNLATRVATSSTRVKTVHNELEIAGATTFLSRSNDAWISSKLKTLMLADPTVAGMRTKVITENGVVYLMGLVSQAEANQAVELVSNASGVTKVVRAFEYID
ncbi:MAG: BON domain-containing protein, partial [Pseudomonadota bacterium]